MNPMVIAKIALCASVLGVLFVALKCFCERIISYGNNSHLARKCAELMSRVDELVSGDEESGQAPTGTTYCYRNRISQLKEEFEVLLCWRFTLFNPFKREPRLVHLRNKLSSLLDEADRIELPSIQVSDEETMLQIRLRRTWKCHLCNAIIRGKRSNLERHIRNKHGKERPFGCKDCKARFHKEKYLERHRQLVHLPCPLNTKICTENSFEFGTPPSLDLHFVGRGKECDLLKTMLSSYGSAVIVSEAGFGNTQLMIAVAKDFLRNEQNVANDTVEIASTSVGDIDHPDPLPVASDTRESDRLGNSHGDAEKVTRIAIWVDANGKASEVIHALAEVTESLMGKKLGDNDRGKQGIVLDKLSNILRRRKEEWLLCLDRVDNAEIDVAIDGILGRVCRMGDGQKGRVLITTHQTGVWWDGMKPEQKLTLKQYSKFTGSMQKLFLLLEDSMKAKSSSESNN